MQITAAVLRSRSGPFGLEAVELEEPRAGEVLVRVVATGVCHTDMVMRDQDLPTPQPVVLGHEGAGVVERVGPGVTKVAPGDHVVMTFNSCGTCPSCHDHAPTYCHEFFPRNFMGARADGSSGLSRDGETIHANIFGQSSFATFALCHERNAVKVSKAAPLEILGPLGCGVMTGAGAVMNALKVPAGRSLAVFGAGAVGLSAVLAAKASGAGPIIVVDINPARLALALSLGADHALDGRGEPVVERIQAITGFGVDYSIDTTANLKVMRQAVDVLAPRGTCGLVGASKMGDELALDAVAVMSGGRVVRGVVEGDADPDTFIPELIDLHLAGRFPFEKLIAFYPLEQINEAVADGEAGRVIKPVVRMG
ncbi:NAD(P)-dependent alcohol dehydrogenase [Caulobacter sp. UNC279MFTsu5.1]|uniref:NAD(P)-dependent alcohol dehydrogenase n=1 Tax=Caulobacter sp. UNC279MFTsu5.1 TaxID=1502775 RepID=UPI000381CD4B|nr:NAD(P)-dependent alcohol dehydrogenase [Caulobacter sp. UNC279MFTsu5.1]SFJ42220.1 aryl-alcohol dehydrogenase [Caulobacter sp. UNC279MFTsu5.1]